VAPRVCGLIAPTEPSQLKSGQSRPSDECLSCRGLSVRFPGVTATLIGYARCSTDEQDLTAQRRILLELGVAEDRLSLDHGLTGTTRDRPGLSRALATVRAGNTLVVPELDRLARSVPDARDIGDSTGTIATSRDIPVDPRTVKAPPTHRSDEEDGVLSRAKE